MRETDFAAFTALLDDVAALLPPAIPLGGTAKAMYFRSLAEHDLAAVRAALDAHVKDPQRGRFFPRPADLIAQLHGLAQDDGRPGAEEAWGIGLRSSDEMDTVVLTEEIAEAMGSAAPILAVGDKIGARMAFKEAYERLVDGARRIRRPIRWMASLGQDPSRVAEEIEKAVRAGLLPRSDLEALPAPADQPLLALVGGTSADSSAAKRGREAMMAFRDQLAARSNDEGPGLDFFAKQATRTAQAAIAEQVAQHLAAGDGLAKAEG